MAADTLSLFALAIAGKSALSLSVSTCCNARRM
jgi:hypothetical protein